MTKHIWLIGGLGNILFQSIFIKKVISDGFKINVYSVFTEKNILTKYLLNWKIHQPAYKELLEKKSIEKVSIMFSVYILLSFYIAKFFKKPPNEYLFTKSGLDVVKNYEKYNHFMGYYQNKEFLIKNKLHIESIISEIKSNLPKKYDEKVVYHFRGGDAKYLNENINILKNVLEKKKEVTIITDDPSYIQKQIKRNRNNVRIISDSVINDFSRMCSASDELYISNSTFSWWASNIVPETCTVYMSKSMYEELSYFGKGKLKII